MNKQEAIEELNTKKDENENVFELEDWDTGLKCGARGAYENAINIVKQIDEPEKPVVPQFVADMIIKRKTAGQSVIKAIENLRFYEDACKWVRNNGETFVKAWLYGYEVEKEKLYTVEIPNPNEPDSGHIVLQKDKNNKVFIDWHYAEDWKGIDSVKLTEAEIKKDFDWAWQFAEEVKE